MKKSMIMDEKINILFSLGIRISAIKFQNHNKSLQYYDAKLSKPNASFPSSTYIMQQELCYALVGNMI